VSFNQYQLSSGLEKALEKMNYTTATPIQEAALPAALEGSDIIGIAQTGTGKTAAFAIPMIQYCLANKGRQALVLAPTRELAAQIKDVIQQLSRFTPEIKTTLIVGGASMRAQLFSLEKKPCILIATPGRLMDHLSRRSVNLSKIGMLVLDEADRMLDMGFGPQIEEILEHITDDHQTLLFSATLPPKIKKLAEKLLKDPKHIAVNAPDATCTQVEQVSLEMSGSDKSDKLLEELQKAGLIKTLIFTRTKRGADRLHKFLKKNEMPSDCIHGDRSQSQRDRSIKDFRSGRTMLLVATDVASRGLDVDHIELVINYDLPQTREDYIHRIGRTGRAGQSGKAMSFITPEERGQWRMIQGEKEDRSGGGRQRRFGGGGGRGGRNSRFGGSGPRSFSDRSGAPSGRGGYRGNNPRGGDSRGPDSRGDSRGFQPRGERGEGSSSPAGNKFSRFRSKFWKKDSVNPSRPAPQRAAR
jgi:superfamily II DNA/RNA helicase